MQRVGMQYHWRNEGYRTFGDFLASLSSRKRKMIRKEREAALRNGLAIRRLTGPRSPAPHWKNFFRFYIDTSERKWGSPYLTREFFLRAGRKHGRSRAACDGRAGRRAGGGRLQSHRPRHALWPQLGLRRRLPIPAFRGLLLPGHRIRHRARIIAGGGRRPGRTQDLAAAICRWKPAATITSTIRISPPRWPISCAARSAPSKPSAPRSANTRRSARRGD